MRIEWLIANPIAHRGFHNVEAGVVENSISSYQAAIDAGFSIESDLQITKDGRVVVFHDEKLDRLTGSSGRVCQHTVDELAKISLNGSNDTIQSLERHLELTAGRVALLLELKGNLGQDELMVEAVGRALHGYNGNVAVMSFNRRLVAQFKRTIPDRPRGLTATGDDALFAFHMKAFTDFDVNFISYDVREIPNRFVSEIKNRGNIPVLSWTVKTAEERQISDIYADQMTFEGFDPRQTFPQQARDSV